MTTRRRIAIVTGSRADFGLLCPVIDACLARPDLETLVIAAGSHLISPAITFRDVKARYPVADSVPMQTAGRTGRWPDADSTGKGIARFARSFESHRPDWVLVLGDRIEAFAAAAAAAIGGLAVAHVHGGDRAEGIADEALRHAITKLSHLHLAATAQSAQRIIRLGEPPALVHHVGSPAIDGLHALSPLSDTDCDALFPTPGQPFRPRAVLLLHPSGMPEHAELRQAHALVNEWRSLAAGDCLCLAPNSDPGRDLIDAQLRAACADHSTTQPVPPARARFAYHPHLPRAAFLALLKRLAAAPEPAVLMGNSSAGLIEAPAIGVRVLNIGPRQRGRERPPAVATRAEHPEDWLPDASPTPEATLLDALRRLLDPAHPATAAPHDHPYGDGHAGPRIAQLLASIDPHNPRLLRKHNTY